MKTMKFYSLRHKKTKELLGTASYSNGDADFCGERTVYFTHSSENVWEAKTLRQAMISLVENPGWYNSSESHPTWSQVIPEMKQSDYEIVEVTKTISTKPVKVSLPVKLPAGTHVDITKPKKGQKGFWTDIYNRACELGATRGVIITDVNFDPHPLIGKQAYLGFGDCVTILGHSRVFDWAGSKCRMIYTSSREMLEG